MEATHQATQEQEAQFKVGFGMLMDLTVRCGEGGAGIRCPVMFGLKLWIKHVQATHTFDMYVRTYSSYRKYMYFIYLPASVLMRWTVSTCVH
eukprot:6400528-Pyramimonas_sp.AAC.1